MPTPAQPPVPSAGQTAKRALREQVLAARRLRSAADSEAAEAAIADHVLAWDVVRRASTVACYVSVHREPGTRRLLDALLAGGTRVLLPVLRPDLDLDWALHDGDLAEARRGLLEPTGPRLGVDAVGGADVVLTPGLAASLAGDRLGYGAGCYDRALARVGADVPIGIVLHDDEVGLVVPTEPHDRRVTHLVTPSGISPSAGRR
ncbi:5-formyltetrahydrofolate cyclo-ligase [Nocardioides currus]|uniref:5-formyltetrahydrofolate cyclo-ligase n=1 Tax=Nocardioides currus TaxID=2133958 RepID=A0A2R7Z1L5_9ACTN|nr:5-formyltetrahydrofolate cyclo-ligase [Nocardioides currus]PUA82515.1 5-formyltetrahydrofolate cyclo-ligase [Nocardioides currus]